jgi:GNAT superfamily N-acetyltransferase
MLRIVKAEEKHIPDIRLLWVEFLKYSEAFHQDCRRRGVGRQMYSKITKWFKAAGVNRVEVQLIGKNKIACAFWKKQGYGDFGYIWEREI